MIADGGDVEGLEDRHSAPSRLWNRIPDDVRSPLGGKPNVICVSSIAARAHDRTEIADPDVVGLRQVCLALTLRHAKLEGLHHPAVFGIVVAHRILVVP
jgi:hypothetical protein